MIFVRLMVMYYMIFTRMNVMVLSTQMVMHMIFATKLFRTHKHKHVDQIFTGVYILQNTMVFGGGIKMAAGEKKIKLRVWGKKLNRREKERGEKWLKNDLNTA